MIQKSQYLVVFICLLTCTICAQEEEGFIFVDSVYATITIDGDMSDWADIPVIYEDTIGDGGEHFDFAAAYIANDANNLYIRVTFAEPEPYGEYPWFLNIGFDTDLNPNTGFGWAPGFGAEWVVQGASVFDQRDCEFVCIEGETGPENNWGAFYFVDVAPLEETTDFEVAIPRDLTFVNDENGLPGLSNPDGSPLFDPAFDEFVMVFETEDAEFNSVEWMPNPNLVTGEAGIFFTFAETPASVEPWSVHE